MRLRDVNLPRFVDNLSHLVNEKPPYPYMHNIKIKKGFKQNRILRKFLPILSMRVNLTEGELQVFKEIFSQLIARLLRPRLLEAKPIDEVELVE